MFADDTAFVADTHQDAQEIIILFAQAVKAFGLKINIRNRGCIPTRTWLSWLRWFHLNKRPRTHSGLEVKIPRLDSNNKLDHEIRTSNNAKAFGQLVVRVWNNKALTIGTKRAVYKAIVSRTFFMKVKPELCRDNWKITMRRIQSSAEPTDS